MTKTLLRWIWKLYPSRWRERFAAEAEADLARSDPRPRALGDALVTLVRAWWDELRSAPSVLEEAVGDARLALRSVLRSPLHATVVVVTLALAVGANGAVFSVSRSVLLGTLPYRSPERIVHVRPAALSMVGAAEWTVDEGFLELPGVEAAALYLPDAGANLVSDDEAARVGVTFVSPGFFRVLGVEPLLGAGLEGPAEEGVADVAVLSHALWVRAFGADPGVVGRTVHLSGRAFRVVGVLPRDAEFPAGTGVWAPMPGVPEFFGGAFGPDAIARIAPDADRNALLAAYRSRVEADWADAPSHRRRPEVSLPGLRETLVGPVRLPLLVLLGAAGAVLLLGCMNLAGIHLSRMAERRVELGVRKALGAARGRVFRRLLVESVVLAGIGGLMALAVAAAASGALAGRLPPHVPGLDEVGLTPALAAFVAGASLLAGVAIGAPAAFRASRLPPAAGTGGRSTDGPGPVRLQSGLVVGQVAVATVLAVGAGLLGRGLAELRAVPLGYDTESVLTFEVQIPSSSYPDAETRRGLALRLEERLRAVPGVTAVGTTNRLPLSEGMGVGLRVLRPGEDEEEGRSASWVLASEGYFRAAGIRLLEGRPPREGDAGTRAEAVIDRRIATELFGEEPATGRRVVLAGFGGNETVRVAGVAAPVRLRGRGSEPHPVVWTPLGDDLWQRAGFAVRASGDPASLAASVRAAVIEVDPAIPPYSLRTTKAAAADEIAARRAVTVVSRLFGVAALLLVGLGLYGLVAQGVAARRRELGIRLALGAGVPELVGRTVAGALGLVVLGVLVGVPGAIAAGRLLTSLLQGVPPGDPVVVAVVVAVVLGVGLAAAWIPAARAGRVDPVDSLRAE